MLYEISLDNIFTAAILTFINFLPLFFKFNTDFSKVIFILCNVINNNCSYVRQKVQRLFKKGQMISLTDGNLLL